MILVDAEVVKLLQVSARVVSTCSGDQMMCWS